MDSTRDPPQQDGRRLRLTTADEQREFASLGRQLLDTGVSADELRQELGYEDVEALTHALDAGRATTVRLEKLRVLAARRLPDFMAQKQEDTRRATEARMEALAERFRTQTEQATARPAPPAATPPRRRGRPPGPHAALRKAASRKEPGLRKQFLTSKQHHRLRDQIEHLWAVDKQFRNWSLLAKVSGLSSGQAAKRAYDVNSSLATLQNIDLFCRLHAGFGSRATKALKAGIPIQELQSFLTGGGTTGVGGPAAADSAAGAGEGATGADGAGAARVAPTRARRGRKPGRPARHSVTASSDVAPEPPPLDATNLLEIASSVDAEMRRLWEMVRFFDGVANVKALPRMMRQAAVETRDHLRSAVACFSGEEEPAPPAPSPAAPVAAPAADATAGRPAAAGATASGATASGATAAPAADSTGTDSTAADSAATAAPAASAKEVSEPA